MNASEEFLGQRDDDARRASDVAESVLVLVELEIMDQRARSLIHMGRDQLSAGAALLHASCRVGRNSPRTGCTTVRSAVQTSPLAHKRKASLPLRKHDSKGCAEPKRLPHLLPSSGRFAAIAAHFLALSWHFAPDLTAGTRSCQDYPQLSQYDSESNVAYVGYRKFAAGLLISWRLPFSCYFRMCFCPPPI